MVDYIIPTYHICLLFAFLLFYEARGGQLRGMSTSTNAILFSIIILIDSSNNIDYIGFYNLLYLCLITLIFSLTKIDCNKKESLLRVYNFVFYLNNPPINPVAFSFRDEPPEVELSVVDNELLPVL